MVGALRQNCVTWVDRGSFRIKFGAKRELWCAGDILKKDSVFGAFRFLEFRIKDCEPVHVKKAHKPVNFA